jgi:hypothetical protein
MKEAAAAYEEQSKYNIQACKGSGILEPISWKTIVNGEVVVVLLDKLG